MASKLLPIGQVQPLIACITRRMKPSRAAGSIQRNTATMSLAGSMPVTLPPPPQPQQGQCQPVDPDIVVFPEAAGRLQIAMGALATGGRPAADAAVAVDQIGLAPQLAFPLRGLLQQVMPRDLVVMRRREPA